MVRVYFWSSVRPQAVAIVNAQSVSKFNIQFVAMLGYYLSCALVSSQTKVSISSMDNVRV